MLVVRPDARRGRFEPLDDDAIAALATCWEAVGRATAEHGVRTALHVDFLSALRRDDALATAARRTDPSWSGWRSTPGS